MEQKARVGHAVAHFGEVIQRQVGHGVGVGLALGLKLGENNGPVGIAVLVEQLVQHATIFEAGVHALAIEGHNGVRSIAEQQHAVVVLPGVAAHRHQRAGGMREKLLRKRGHQRHRIGEYAAEKGGDLGGRLQRGKAFRPFKRKKQGAIERAVEVGQRNHQVLAAGPDVQGVFLQLPRAIGACGDGQLFVAVFEIVLRIVVAVGFL